jgi:predicted O-methyltransferase YrrM
MTTDKQTQTKPLNTVFSGTAATAYAAFCLRDPYYHEMAQTTFGLARARLEANGHPLKRILELGCGIGISTMAMANAEEQAQILAIEPEEAMRQMAALHFVGRPQVRIVEGRAESCADLVSEPADLAIACQMIHLVHGPKPAESRLTQAMAQVAKSLAPGGVFAFDLGPSNFAFQMALQDHRASDRRDASAVPTEFCHPLYQQAERILHGILSADFEDLPQTLWPDPAARLTRADLEERATTAGLGGMQVEESLLPLDGTRILDFLRNGWAVFFRWGKLSSLPAEQKVGYVGRTLDELAKHAHFQQMRQAMAYHPTAVVTFTR